VARGRAYVMGKKPGESEAKRPKKKPKRHKKFGVKENLQKRKEKEEVIELDRVDVPVLIIKPTDDLRSEDRLYVKIASILFV